MCSHSGSSELSRHNDWASRTQHDSQIPVPTQKSSLCSSLLRCRPGQTHFRCSAYGSTTSGSQVRAEGKTVPDPHQLKGSPSWVLPGSFTCKSARITSFLSLDCKPPEVRTKHLNSLHGHTKNNAFTPICYATNIHKGKKESTLPLTEAHKQATRRAAPRPAPRGDV